MLPEKKVKELIGLMNSISSVKIPAMKEVFELFEMTMDEFMVDFLTLVGTSPKSLQELKEIYIQLHHNEDGWEEFNDKVNLCGFIHVESNERRDLYSLTPIFPGWIEFYIVGPENEQRKAVVTKFMEFYDNMFTMNKFPMRQLNDYKSMKYPSKGIAPRFKVYPSTGSIGKKEVVLDTPLQSKHEVLTANSVYELLEKFKDELAVGNCLCRLGKKYRENDDCHYDVPLQSCMMLGAIATNLVENGSARKLTYEEAVAMVEDFDKKGCVHSTFHYKNSADLDEFAICNCCTDCCINYGGYLKGSLSKIYTRSYYSPKTIALEKCTGCNLCGKYCPTGATYYDKDKKELIFDYSKCVGCGQCVTQCHFDVREMVPDQRDVFVKTRKPAKK